MRTVLVGFDSIKRKFKEAKQAVAEKRADSRYEKALYHETYKQEYGKTSDEAIEAAARKRARSDAFQDASNRYGPGRKSGFSQKVINFSNAATSVSRAVETIPVSRNLTNQGGLLGDPFGMEAPRGKRSNHNNDPFGVGGLGGGLGDSFVYVSDGPRRKKKSKSRKKGKGKGGKSITIHLS